MAELGTEIRLDCPFETAVERTVAALAAEGFGVISRIDLDRAFHEKLGLDFRRYTILGACNPKLAHAAVSARPEVGLLLPCNVTVEQAGDGAVVRIVDAAAMLSAGSLADEPAFKALAEDASGRLARVAAALAAA
ncbi:DUF302 domain-containing protein [Thermaurantiacus sp.]